MKKHTSFLTFLKITGVFIALFLFSMSTSFSVFAQTQDCDAHFVVSKILYINSRQTTQVSFSDQYAPYNSLKIYNWDFGDGTTSTINHGTNTFHEYAQFGKYKVCLNVIDSSQAGNICNASWCDSITVDTIKKCNAKFIQYGRSSSGIDFRVSDNPKGISYLWDFGDGATDTFGITHHLYSQPGNYYGCLTVTDSSSSGIKCKDVWCDSINVNMLRYCSAYFIYSKKVNYVEFSTKDFGPSPIPYPNNPGTYYLWDFGDGTTSRQVDPKHAYALAGTYNACLTVVDSLGGVVACTDTKCDSIHITTSQKYCNAKFAFRDEGSGIHFLTPVGGSPVYFWDFGDGTTSGQMNPLHTFSQAGTSYSVCLTVTDSSDGSGSVCTDSWCDSVFFKGPQCSAHFIHGLPSVAGTRFTPPVTNLIRGMTYTWNFGDGTTSNIRNPLHKFLPGSYNVCLTTKDTSVSGTIVCTDTWCDSLVWVGSDAHFTFSIDKFNRTIFLPSVNNASSTTFTWDFGDGKTSNLRNPVHYYSQPGTYNVCLTVKSDSSLIIYTETWCKTVQVAAVQISCDAHFQNLPAQPYYPFIDPNIITPYCATITPVLINPDNIYTTDYGDGTLGSYGLHFYAQPGIYNVCLTTFNRIDSCSETWCDSLTIQARAYCDAHFTYSQGIIIFQPPNSIFLNLFNSPNATYSCDWGDGTISNNRSHTYSQKAAYYVCMTVTDSTALGGVCVDSWCDSVNVIPRPYPIIPFVGSENTSTSGSSGMRLASAASSLEYPLNAFIYPNPFHNEAVLHIENASSANVLFIMYDCTGRLVFSKKNLANGDFKLSKNDLGSGLYYYRVIDNGKDISGKLIIE